MLMYREVFYCGSNTRRKGKENWLLARQPTWKHELLRISKKVYANFQENWSKEVTAITSSIKRYF